jgi:ubiquinone biosynthesis accessory factor UbiJ
MLDPAAITAKVANRALAHEQTLRARLAVHAGAVFRIVAGPGAATLAITDGGTLAPAEADAMPALTLTIRPTRLPALLRDPARFDDLVDVEGDASLAATIKDLGTTMPWFVERLFGEVFGSIVGQRVADGGRELLGLPEYASTRVGASVASYLRDEANVAATTTDSQALADEVRDVAARVDTLAARIERLAARKR